MSNALQVTADTFEAEVKQCELPVLVDFYAEWCGPCKMMAPVLDEVAAESDGKYKICKVDCESDGALAGDHGVSSIPCLVLFKGGAEVDRKVGACPKAELVTWLEQNA